MLAPNTDRTVAVVSIYLLVTSVGACVTFIFLTTSVIVLIPGKDMSLPS